MPVQTSILRCVACKDMALWSPTLLAPSEKEPSSSPKTLRCSWTCLNPNPPRPMSVSRRRVVIAAPQRKRDRTQCRIRTCRCLPCIWAAIFQAFTSIVTSMKTTITFTIQQTKVKMALPFHQTLPSALHLRNAPKEGVKYIIASWLHCTHNQAWMTAPVGQSA